MLFTLVSLAPQKKPPPPPVFTAHQHSSDVQNRTRAPARNAQSCFSSGLGQQLLIAPRFCDWVHALRVYSPPVPQPNATCLLLSMVEWFVLVRHTERCVRREREKDTLMFVC